MAVLISLGRRCEIGECHNSSIERSETLTTDTWRSKNFSGGTLARDLYRCAKADTI